MKPYNSSRFALTNVVAISAVEKSLVRNSKLMVVFCSEFSREHSTLRSPPSSGVTRSTLMLGPMFCVFLRFVFFFVDLSSPVSESAAVALKVLRQ